MFGKRKVPESERLRVFYADQTDGELLRLNEQREGLTDTAREVLAATLEQRGLESVDDTTASAKHSSDYGDEHADSAFDDEVLLGTFSDTSQLRDLLRLLEDAALAFRLRDPKDVYGGPPGERPLGISVFVEESRRAEANRLVRQVVFAATLDRDESPVLTFAPPTDLTLLLTCGREDALEIVRLLCDAGVSFYWRDGNEDREVLGEQIVALEVKITQREQAEKAVQEWMSQTAQAEDDRPAPDEEHPAA